MARIVIVLLLAAFIAPSAAPVEGDRGQELREILGGLEHGIVALERLERRDALDIVRKIADEVREKIRAAEGQAPRVEREGAERLRVEREQAERERAAAVHEAAIARERAAAARADERAAAAFEREVAAARERELAGARERDGAAAAGERERLVHSIEVMRLAVQALREGERHDAAELLERAIRARETALEGRRDEEARRIREGAPDVPQQVEMLAQAARLWNQLGHERKAAAIAELARHLQERALHRGGGGAAPLEERLSALERRLAEISAAVAEMRQAVRRLNARDDE
jgi:hypothetical protein